MIVKGCRNGEEGNNRESDASRAYGPGAGLGLIAFFVGYERSSRRH